MRKKIHNLLHVKNVFDFFCPCLSQFEHIRFLQLTDVGCVYVRRSVIDCRLLDFDDIGLIGMIFISKKGMRIEMVS